MPANTCCVPVYPFAPHIHTLRATSGRTRRSRATSGQARCCRATFGHTRHCRAAFGRTRHSRAQFGHSRRSRAQYRHNTVLKRRIIARKRKVNRWNTAPSNHVSNGESTNGISSRGPYREPPRAKSGPFRTKSGTVPLTKGPPPKRRALRERFATAYAARVI